MREPNKNVLINQPNFKMYTLRNYGDMNKSLVSVVCVISVYTKYSFYLRNMLIKAEFDIKLI